MSHLQNSDEAVPASFVDGPPLPTEADVVAQMRRRRLLQRLDGLAEDALIEGCENAARILRNAANDLRTAILRDAWDREIASSTASQQAVGSDNRLRNGGHHDGSHPKHIPPSKGPKHHRRKSVDTVFVIKLGG